MVSKTVAGVRGPEGGLKSSDPAVSAEHGISLQHRDSGFPPGPHWSPIDLRSTIIG